MTASIICSILAGIAAFGLGLCILQYYSTEDKNDRYTCARLGVTCFCIMAFSLLLWAVLEDPQLLTDKDSDFNGLNGMMTEVITPEELQAAALHNAINSGEFKFYYQDQSVNPMDCNLAGCRAEFDYHTNTVTLS